MPINVVILKKVMQIVINSSLLLNVSYETHIVLSVYFGLTITMPGGFTYIFAVTRL